MQLFTDFLQTVLWYLHGLCGHCMVSNVYNVLFYVACAKKHHYALVPSILIYVLLHVCRK